jgi:hypothetical protein
MPDWPLPVTISSRHTLDGKSWSASCHPLADALEAHPTRGFLLSSGGPNLVRRFRNGPTLGLKAATNSVISAITGMNPVLLDIFLWTMPDLVQDEPYELPFSV